MRRTNHRHLPVGTWRLHKHGNAPVECEDAFAVTSTFHDPTHWLRAAVADGATTSSFSKEWAEILVKDFVKHSTYSALRSPASVKECVLKRVGALQTEWRGTFDIDNLPWYAREKLRRGAHTAFLGLVIHSSLKYRGQSQGHWTAVSAGDTCLFQVRSDSLIESIPLKSRLQFSNAVPLLGSIQSSADNARATSSHRGTWQRADRIYIMSDALAAWFLGAYEACTKPWDIIDDTLVRSTYSNEPEYAMNASGAQDGSPAFESFVNALRDNREIKNDDAVLVRIELT
jgi:hypothetical protein